MPKKKFTDEMKAAFMTAVHGYMDKGWSAGSAYKQVAAEYQQEGKEVPEKNTCYNWLAREKRESGGEGADAANRPTCPTSPTGPTDAEPTGPGEPEPEGPEGPPGETPELDDYTRKLEAMLRLYRRRTEADVDAVCDRLLPDLCAEEE